MLSESQKATYAGIWALKMLDLGAKEGGVDLDVLLPNDWYPLEEVIEQLVMDDLVAIDRKKGRYVLTPKGIDYIGTLIDEAEAYIEEFDDEEPEAIARTLRKRNIDPMRVRFLWGWYQGEFDDPIVFQQRRGFAEVERDWASFLLSDAFYQDLARDLE
ncbi:MAG: hypothetical protein R6X02_04650 [Enhygromyxa sp.]